MVLILYYNDLRLILILWLCIFDILQFTNIKKTYETSYFKLSKYFDHKQKLYHSYVE